MNSKQGWFLFLHYWNYKKIPLGSGLTIPYLIGVEYIATGVLITVDILLNNLFKNEEQIFSIRYCSVIGEYILQLNDSDDYSLNYFPKSNNLSVVDKELITQLKKNKLINFLKNKYSKNIEIKKFSKELGRWIEFSKNETKLIKNVLQQQI